MKKVLIMLPMITFSLNAYAITGNEASNRPLAKLKKVV
jgi:hypothetical protein